MNIKFEIEYRTIYGEDLFLNVLQADGTHTSHAMTTRDGVIWTCQLEVEKAIDYFYTVTWKGREKRTEWVFCPHSFDPKEVSDPSLPRGDGFRISTVVTDVCQSFVVGQTMF